MKLTVRLFLMATAIFVSLSLHAQSTGDLSFVDICADGPDAFTLVALEDIPANRTIYLRDDEWNGTTWADTNEGFITWSTGANPIARGTIISFSGVTDGQTLTVNIGTAVASGNRGLGGGDESIFCYTGTDANTPSTFICAIGKGTLSLAFGSLAGTGLTQGTTAILFPTTLDIAAYNGPRTGLNKPAYVAALNIVSNFQTQDGSGDQNADGIAPDLPFSLVPFSFSLTDVTPPSVSNVQVSGAAAITVLFSEQVTNATDVARYSFSPALSINNVVLNGSGDGVTISTANLVVGRKYQLTINGVADAATNVQTTPFVQDNLYYNDYSGSDLVLTELMYNVGAGGDSLEFVELYNKGTAAIELGGLRLADGIQGLLPERTLAPGQLALVALDTARARQFYGVPFYSQWSGDALSNGGETISLRNFSNAVVDGLTYDDVAPWPTQPDGTGPSLEIVDPMADNSLATNWRFSFTNTGRQYGTPAYTVFASPGSLPVLSVPNISFKPVVQWIGESRDSADIVIELTGSNPLGASFRVRLNNWGTATAGTDLQSYVKDTSFAAGVTGTITLRVDVTDDAIAETDEYAVFELTNVAGANIINGAYHTLHLVDNDVAAPAASGELQLSLLTSLRNGSSGTNSAEIVAYDKNTRRLWVVNSIAGKINIYNFSNPAAPVLFTTVDILPLGGINSVVIQNGVIAAAIENTNKLLPGQVVFFDADGNVLKQINAGVLPDMVGISPDGKYVVTADEAEPATDYLTDPEGSVTVIDISGGIAGLTQANATTISLASLNPLKSSLRAAGVRLFGRFGNVADGSSVAQDLEPEYVTFSPDSKLAYVTCQENNAVLVIDLDAKAIAQQAGNPLLLPLGLKDHSLPGNGLDASDRADSINIARWRVKGMYMPDAIATIQSSKGTFYITANEGDAREYSALTEETQLGALRLDPTAFPDSVVLRQQGNLGRINISNQTGDTDNDGDMDELHVLGSRSVTIWDANGNRVWDSGEDLERIVRANTRAFFNANNGTGNPAIKNRSDNKGPEPEGVVIGTICSKTFAFVTLERSGGVVVYDVTDPQAPVFVTYANNRTSPAVPAQNDLGPEGILFIPSTESPNGRDLVLLANEISSSVSVYEITCNNALPIVLQQFGAHLRGADAVLHWQVASADDVRHFVIEHSRDGRQYRPLAQVGAAGRQYEYVHAQLPAGNHYYRLLMADKDGSSRYSRTVLLQKGQAASAIVGLQQNPVTSTATVVLASQQPQRGQLRISDATGRILVQAVRQLPAGQQQWPVNIGSLPAGYYYLQVSLADGSTANLPFVKQ